MAAGKEAKSMSYFSDNLSVKAFTVCCLLQLAQISSQELHYWRTLGYVSAVSCVNAESSNQMTDLPSGLVIASVDYPLNLNLFNRSRGPPHFVTDHSLIPLSKAIQTFSKLLLSHSNQQWSHITMGKERQLDRLPSELLISFTFATRPQQPVKHNPKMNIILTVNYLQKILDCNYNYC